MISAPDRRKTVLLIDEARHAGARLEAACDVVGISSRTYQRWTGKSDIREDARPTAIRPEPANKLTKEETEKVLSICHDPEFASLPPGQIVPRLADKGTYIASESTFYRILHLAREQHHRGRSRAPRHSTPPKGFCATGPNQVWTWDVTWLPSQIRGMYFYLYMIVDVFSRKIVGWEVHSTESAELGATFIHKAILAQGCILKPPVIHADNGGAQKGYTIKAKMDALGVTKSYSRPRVSNDNPFSESLFRTCKYRPNYPGKPFESIEGSRQWVASFVRWYNYKHLHSGIRFVTPEDRHTGRDKDILENRDRIYRQAKQKCPKRWSGDTRNWDPEGPVWLNPPKTESDSKGSEHFPDGFRQTG